MDGISYQNALTRPSVFLRWMLLFLLAARLPGFPAIHLSRLPALRLAKPGQIAVGWTCPASSPEHPASGPEHPASGPEQSETLI